MMRFPEAESTTLELKQDFPRNDQIIKTLIGFCNQNGGRIVIGVQNDGTITGISSSQIEEAMETLESAVYQASLPPIVPRVYAQLYGEKNLLIIEVSAGMNKPYHRKSEGMAKGCYVRIGRSTVRATPEMVEELRWQSQGIDFERLPIYHAGIEELDQTAIEQFVNRRPNHGTPKVDSALLHSYGLVTSEHSRVYPTYAGILLFGKKPQVFCSEAMIICSHFHGTKGREVIATVDCEGTIIQQFSQSYEFILSRLNRSFTIDGPQRTEEWEIPRIAIREALLNALIHRNYHIKGPTKVAIYQDRLEIFSPGGFPGPIKVDNLRAGLTYLRNPAICKVFREAGLVEKLGSGLIAIFDSYEQRGLAPPQIIEGENYIKCVLPRLIATKLTEDDQYLLALFDRQNQISISEITQWCGISRATAQRRLSALVKSGQVEKLGAGPATRYRRTDR